MVRGTLEPSNDPMHHSHDPLYAKRFGRVFDFIDRNLDDDLSVTLVADSLLRAATA